ncbi:MAG: MBL fold metallo-hydrolase, partial [Phycisphaerae bacterium]
VNIYVLDDDNGWTVIDTGNNSPECRAIIDELFLRGPFSTKPVSRVLATHYHNDHVGLVGHIAEFGAEFWATRTCWLTARLLQMDQRTVPCDNEIRFLQQASLGAMELAAYRRSSPSK